MAVTQAQLDAMTAAAATGAVRVDYPGGGGVTYRSLADLNAAIALAQEALNIAAGIVPVRRVKIFGTKDL